MANLTCPTCEGFGDCWACDGCENDCTACDGTNSCGCCEGEGSLPEYHVVSKQDDEAYRPSNGTDGDVFMDSWCASCSRQNLSDHDDDFKACDIQLRAMMYPIDDDNYPVEWVFKNGKPACTAYIVGDLSEPKCPLTPDMFEGV